MAVSPAQRRYNWRVVILAIVYAAVLLPVCWLFARHLVHGPLAYLLGALPALPVSGFFVAIGLYLAQERDEYLRMLLVRQSLIATGVAMTAATFWGFLEGFDLLPHVVGYAWPIVWFAGLGFGAGVNAAIERRAA
ncbi:hypothetical protein M9979_03120 [Sphingomonas sp. RP10(2022)]|uniref:Uncharacterized protein n=1 Tax=Sphingomonas liriopis TaxID=2949094 RepID=A0A9X2HMT0_9SPHN|nr:hypothetical protein [Sphingomonas liriopis]MCP3733868.1 hypothetical protein [Sphingomonas liriopis]